MAQFWWQPSQSWWGGWGPFVDPGPDDWGGGRWGGVFGGWRVPWPKPGDPAPWFATRPVARPFATPWQPEPSPWMAAGPFPEPWLTAGPQPQPWSPGRFAAPQMRLRFPGDIDPSDPSPEDVRARVEVFKRWAHSVLQAAGFREEQLVKATVADLVQAVELVSTPPIARADNAAVTAAQVAEMDRTQLERLRHHLTAERQRIETLAAHVETQLKQELHK